MRCSAGFLERCLSNYRRKTQLHVTRQGTSTSEFRVVFLGVRSECNFPPPGPAARAQPAGRAARQTVRPPPGAKLAPLETHPSSSPVGACFFLPAHLIPCSLSARTSTVGRQRPAPKRAVAKLAPPANPPTSLRRSVAPLASPPPYSPPPRVLHIRHPSSLSSYPTFLRFFILPRSLTRCLAASSILPIHAHT